MLANDLSSVESIFEKYLTGPVEEFLSRPKKDLRSELIKIGYLLYSPQIATPESDDKLEKLCEALEWVHAGSLIVDDIQDQSHERRGDKCLHLIYGVPCALNAANWMYFEALKKINEINLDDAQRFKMISLTIETMSKAHQGQALDLMTNIESVPKEEIFLIGEKGHALKSGALFSLALKLGAILGDSHTELSLIEELGTRLGCSLQRFDDLGNLYNEGPKRFEDLKLGRLTWPWMYISQFGTDNEFTRFRELVKRLPESSELEVFLEVSPVLLNAKKYAKMMHHQLYDYLNIPFPGAAKDDGLHHLKNILQKVSYAYI